MWSVKTPTPHTIVPETGAAPVRFSLRALLTAILEVMRPVAVLHFRRLESELPVTRYWLRHCQWDAESDLMGCSTCTRAGGPHAIERVRTFPGRACERWSGDATSMAGDSGLRLRKCRLADDDAMTSVSCVGETASDQMGADGTE